MLRNFLIIFLAFTVVNGLTFMIAPPFACMCASGTSIATEDYRESHESIRWANPRLLNKGARTSQNWPAAS